MFFPSNIVKCVDAPKKRSGASVGPPLPVAGQCYTIVRDNNGLVELEEISGKWYSVRFALYEIKKSETTENNYDFSLKEIEEAREFIDGFRQ